MDWKEAKTVVEEIKRRTERKAYSLVNAGVANFFINQKDLEKRDFSRILYNWDCC